MLKKRTKKINSKYPPKKNSSRWKMISQNLSGPLTGFWVAGPTRVFFYSTRCERDYRRSNILKTLQVLTVRSGEANSHKARGWEQLTDSVDFEKTK